MRVKNDLPKKYKTHIYIYLSVIVNKWCTESIYNILVCPDSSRSNPKPAMINFICDKITYFVYQNSKLAQIQLPYT